MEPRVCFYARTREGYFMKIITLILTFITLIGCSSGDSGSSPKFEKNACVTAGAAYLFQYTEVNGTCGSVPDQTVVIPSSGLLATSSGNTTCSNGPGAHYEGCTVFVDSDCSGSNASLGAFTFEQTGKVTWASNGSSARGLVTWNIVAKAGVCTSTYGFVATRL